MLSIKSSLSNQTNPEPNNSLALRNQPLSLTKHSTGPCERQSNQSSRKESSKASFARS